jgi:hypothetical protein
MAWLAEMSRAEAKPECNRAAETAFEFNCFLSMDLTLTYTNSSLLNNTCSADKIFFFVVLSIILLAAFSHSSEVWLIALETVVERHFI